MGRLSSACVSQGTRGKEIPAYSLILVRPAFTTVTSMLSVNGGVTGHTPAIVTVDISETEKSALVNTCPGLP